MGIMTLEESMDFLAKNCPHVFKPISEEMTRLKTENETISSKVDLTQSALDDLIFNMMSGGN